MPLSRLILILAVVFIAAALSIGVALWAASLFDLPAVALTGAVPALLLGYVLWRVLSQPRT